jgi:iron complex transport system substrate-binding protein
LVLSRLAHIALPAVALAVVAACGGTAPPAAAHGIRLVGDRGDTVVLAAPARRIVSLSPATTELLFALGAGDRVVGRTPYDNWPPAAARVPVVSEGITLDLEGILAARPDLVIVYPSSANTAGVERLRSLGVPTLYARTDRISDVTRLAQLLGRATGRRAAADSLARAFARELVAATAPVSDTPGLFLLVWDQPPMTVGAESYLTEVMRRAGGRNVFAELAAPSAPVSIEAVAARDPDFILTSAQGTPAFAARPEWQAVRAVRERRFVSIAGSEFDRPGPRTPAAIRTLRRRLAEAR